MKSDRDWDLLLGAAWTIPFSGKLSRAVAQLSYDASKKYLFTSAKRNRCNPEGVPCIYMAEDRDTAVAEYDKYYTDIGDDQPCLLFTAKLTAKHILDLGNPVLTTYFGLTDADFFSAFRVNANATLLEQLGRAIDRQKNVSAVRFPSDAMYAKSEEGFNIAIFKNALVPPNSLRILGPSGAVLEEWP